MLFKGSGLVVGVGQGCCVEVECDVFAVFRVTGMQCHPW